MMNKNRLCKLFTLALLLGMILIVTACGRAGDDFEPVAMYERQAADAPASVSHPAPEPEPERVGGMGVYRGYEVFADSIQDAEFDFWEDADFADGTYVPETTAPDDADAPSADDSAPLADDVPTPAQQTPAPLGVDLMQRMIIRSADMSLNTLYYSDTITGIETTVDNRGGFIESSRQWTVYCDQMGMLWRAEYVIRVPVGLFDTTNQELMALGQVRYFTTTSRDATHEFNDLGSRLQIRLAEETRVARMLEDATELTDIINLEARLTSLRLVIDAYRRRREEIDHLATFSTIRLSVFEVVELPEIVEEEYEEEDDEEDYAIAAYGFGDRIGGAFSASANATAQALEVLAVFLATIILPAGLLAAVGLVVYLTVKKVNGGKWPLRWVKL